MRLHYLSSFRRKIQFRIKTTFGGRLRARKIEHQKIENRIKSGLLNLMTSIGMPGSIKDEEIDFALARSKNIHKNKDVIQ